MKRLLLAAILCGILIFSFTPANAETYPIGADVALKVDYFHFLDSNISRTNGENGVYIGVAAYKQLFFPNFHLGMEVGWAGTSGSVTHDFLFFGPVTTDTDITYIPIEFNAKYVIPVFDFLSIDIGAGISINNFDIEINNHSKNDWVFGGQVFSAVNYKYGNWLIGINVKYQPTEELGGRRNSDPANRSPNPIPANTSADNVRIGLQLGYSF